jgi:hypothetical protein
MNTSFATYAASKNDFICNYLLANSIHDFAGELSDSPLRIYVASGIDMQDEIKRFTGLNVMFTQYPKTRRFRYAFKPAAATACETDVKEGTVIWLDRHMLIPSPCTDALLNPLEQFAYRPPHLKLLGVSVDEPISNMWTTACKIAGVDESAMFPVYTEVDRNKIWSYFSAGHFSFRAEAGIMRKWDALFNELADHPNMKPFLDDSVKVYLHQIALTLAVLRNQDRDALKPLPAFYGYPTHLHGNIEKEYQANQMDELHTAFYSCNNGVKPSMPISKQLMSWLKDKINVYKS